MARKKSKRRRGGGGSGGDGGGARVQSKFTYYFLRVAPIVIAVAALTIYFAAKSPQGAAATGTLGTVIWLAVWLGALGSSVPPRDSTRGSAIDFGKRQNGP
jgi:hypothetical protein